MTAKQVLIEYIQEQNRAVTIDEILKQTDLEDTDENYNKLRQIAEKLVEQERLTSDLYRGDRTSKTRYYPTQKL